MCAAHTHIPRNTGMLHDGRAMNIELCVVKRYAYGVFVTFEFYEVDAGGLRPARAAVPVMGETHPRGSGEESLVQQFRTHSPLWWPRVIETHTLRHKCSSFVGVSNQRTAVHRESIRVTCHAAL